MADKPILFSAPMVRALLEGRITQTRRILKPQPPQDMSFIRIDKPKLTAVFGYVLPVDDVKIPFRCMVNDRFWVKETWQALTLGDFQPTKHEPCELRFAATDPCADLDKEARGYVWRPSIFMPRWASRITLIVTDVRVERLQDISEQDAIAEGCIPDDLSLNPNYIGPAKAMYANVWDDINGPGGWDANPWVVACTFSVIKQNIDQIKEVA